MGARLRTPEDTIQHYNEQVVVRVLSPYFVLTPTSTSSYKHTIDEP